MKIIIEEVKYFLIVAPIVYTLVFGAHTLAWLVERV